MSTPSPRSGPLHRAALAERGWVCAGLPVRVRGAGLGEPVADSAVVRLTYRGGGGASPFGRSRVQADGFVFSGQAFCVNDEVLRMVARSPELCARFCPRKIVYRSLLVRVVRDSGCFFRALRVSDLASCLRADPDLRPLVLHVQEASCPPGGPPGELGFFCWPDEPRPPPPLGHQHAAGPS